ncbi:ASKHA domain-containing protein [Sneathiella limimaris]|uniref:ASKHA domain-containing protein n=1 Tax=Sneathiella limimaris TaxID=1964213 RepID=UPI00146ADA76|nr:ASKHA domain-containing protein [Sneathiella limimaris]
MSGDQKHQVVFLPSGKRGYFDSGTPLLEAGRSLGVDIDSVCGGRGICGRCQVDIVEGQFDKFGIKSAASALTPISENEKRFDQRRGLKPGRRLSCHTRILEDVVIDVPSTSQVHRQVIVKTADDRKIEMDPAIRLHYVSVEEPDMHNPTGDFERLSAALKDQWGLGDLECDLRTLQKLQKCLREGDWKVTVAIHRELRITEIWPGFHDKAYGIAVDVGSTTIALHLCDLSAGAVVASAGMMNPQIRYGEDLMSRVSYVMMNPGGDEALTQTVRQGINELLADVCDQADVNPDTILNGVMVGNPIMHHLLLGIDPTELGGAPFALSTNSGLTLWASEIDLNSNPDGRVYFLPCIAGHVGADTTAVILSEAPHLQEKITLIVDVGTNAELVLGNRDKLLAASSPTGPAFEGAQIACGQRATAGAIERVRIDPVTKIARFKVIGSDLWSDEEGFEEETRLSGVTGICGSGIIEALAEMYLAGILTEDGIIDGRHAGTCSLIEPVDRTFAYVLVPNQQNPIRIYQTDVRAIQLAKAALYAGAKLLMDRLGVTEVDRVLLTGAFGSHIDTRYAMILGMIPDCDLEEVKAVGNAAGNGARIALLNQTARDEAEQLVRRVEKVETAVEPAFQQYFVDAMALPHKRDPFPHLRKVMALPEPAPKASDDPAGGRRRRRNRRSQSLTG